MHKNENRPGYKKTKVGWIPEGWNICDLQGVSKFITKGSTPTTYGFEWAEPSHYAIPFLRSECVSANGFTESGLQYISDAAHASLSRSEVKPDDILMTITGNVGRVIRFPKKFRRANINQHIARIRVNSAAASNEFVFQSLELPFYSKHYQSILTGQAYPQISLVQVRETPIPFPGLPEQEAIAEVLECWDKGIRILEKKIGKKRLIKKGLMQRLLSGKIRLPGFSKSWKSVKFGEVTAPRKERIDSRRDGTREFCVELEHIEQKTGKLLGNTSAGETSSLKTVFQNGDILFGKLRAYLRKYWLADRAGACSTEIWVFAHKKTQITAQYLFQIIKTDLFIDAASSTTGTHMPRSDWNAVKNYSFAIPSLEEQRAIAEVLTAADGEIAALERKLALWKDQKKFLLNNLVSGTIRLPEFRKEF